MTLRQNRGVEDRSASPLTPSLQRLLAVEPLGPTGQPLAITRPLTPLRETVLMTNARDQPTVGREIVAEIESADRIDLVLAFIRWTGVRDLLPALRRHTDAGKPLRVITTTYTGSTELRALQALSDVGAEVKVSYDTASTRLDAKAWCFRNVVLFTRTDLNGRTRPYFCAGRARYVEHRSERPMQITWELHDPLPGDVFSAFRAAAA